MQAIVSPWAQHHLTEAQKWRKYGVDIFNLECYSSGDVSLHCVIAFGKR
jgi:hypothetical protein